MTTLLVVLSLFDQIVRYTNATTPKLADWDALELWSLHTALLGFLIVSFVVEMTDRSQFCCFSRRKRKRETKENADVLRALNSGKFQSMLLKGDATGALAFADGLDDEEFDSSKSYLPSDAKFVSCAFSALLVRDSDACKRLLDHIDRSGGLCDRALLRCNGFGLTALGVAIRRDAREDSSFARFRAPRFAHLWQAVTPETPESKKVMTPLLSAFYVQLRSAPMLQNMVSDDILAEVVGLTVRPETLNAVDGEGYTALTHAIRVGRTRTLHALLLRLPELVLEPDRLGPAVVSVDLAFQRKKDTSPTLEEMKVAISSARVYMEHYNATATATVTGVLKCLLPPLRALILEFALICRLAVPVCPGPKPP